jgi:hypothetical protein
MHFKYTFLTILIASFTAFAQENNRTLNVSKSKTTIKLDGVLDEAAWKTAELVDNYKQITPYDTSYAKYKTITRVTFDENNLYIAGICYQKREEYIVSSLKRDPQNGTTDLYFFTIDTFKDKVNAFYFGVSPLNVQKEGLISNGSELSIFWDNKWSSAVKNFDDHWVVEVAIPFKTLRYRDGQNSWRMQFARNVLAMPELSAWSPVPRNFRPSNIAFAGEVNFVDALPKPGKNVTVIPYVSGGGAFAYPRDRETKQPLPTTSDFTRGVGFDAKIGVTPSLNLDLTVNPDFSQVEVDRQVTNLSRFEIFFPERRQFFLENSDLFDKYGFPNTRPFFTRRIGIAQDTTNGNNMLVPILAGARLSGKLNDKWRIGLLNMQTRKQSFANENLGYVPAANYSVASIQRRVLNRSFISAVLTNKENLLADLTEAQRKSYSKFNRVAGLEFNFFSKDGNWEGESYLHKALTPYSAPDQTTTGHFLGFSNENIQANLGYNRIGENYNAEMGFVPRLAIQGLYSESGLSFYPKKGKFAKIVNNFGPYIELNNTYSLAGKLFDREFDYGVNFQGHERTEVSLGLYDYYTYLPFAFDPTNSGGEELPANSSYQVRGAGASFEMGTRYKLSLSGEYYAGQYFNGNFQTIDFQAVYRIQPIGQISVSANYNDIRLPAPYSSAKFLLLSPRAELSFSRSVFFSTFFQYNVQANNFNINSRLQWRFKPVSDLFLVYTDNYFAQAVDSQPLGGNRFTAPIQAFAPKNRALVLKLTYWLNV